jgi:hypothetical protein
MSNKTLRIFISLACLIFYTCDNEENPEQSYNIGPESQGSIIQMENENIDFIFCLLNENTSLHLCFQEFFTSRMEFQTRHLQELPHG